MQPKVNKCFKKKNQNIGNRADHIEERIRELKDRNLKFIQVEGREIALKNEEILQELSHSFRMGTIRIIGIPAGQ